MRYVSFNTDRRIGSMRYVSLLSDPALRMSVKRKQIDELAPFFGASVNL